MALQTGRSRRADMSQKHYLVEPEMAPKWRREKVEERRPNKDRSGRKDMSWLINMCMNLTLPLYPRTTDSDTVMSDLPQQSALDDKRAETSDITIRPPYQWQRGSIHGPRGRRHQTQQRKACYYRWLAADHVSGPATISLWPPYNREWDRDIDDISCAVNSLQWYTNSHYLSQQTVTGHWETRLWNKNN